jgi:hypothetical protein
MLEFVQLRNELCYYWQYHILVVDAWLPGLIHVLLISEMKLSQEAYASDATGASSLSTLLLTTTSSTRRAYMPLKMQ